jgi:Uma2 family endonuclease
MNIVATPPAVTPEDLLRMPDQGQGYELVDGRLKELNVSAKSSRVGAGVVRLLWNHCEAHQPGWVFQSDASFQCFPNDANRVRRADAAFIAFERFTTQQYEAEGHISVCPDLVAEVISPNDLAAEVHRKVQEWLDAGVRLLWLIDPDAKLVFCYRPGEDDVSIRRERDTLTAEPVLAGFACPVADLFRLPAGALPGAPPPA